MEFILSLLLFTHQLNPPRVVKTSCLKYEPHSSVLYGKIKRRVFPGRPNYESSAEGDEREEYWILHLDKPKCVSASADWEEARSVSEIQLVFEEGQKQYDKYRALLGWHVIASGTMFHAHTGHHHTTVLLTVSRIKRG